MTTAESDRHAAGRYFDQVYAPQLYGEGASAQQVGEIRTGFVAAAMAAQGVPRHPAAPAIAHVRAWAAVTPPLLVHTVRCPLCGDLPAGIVGPTQAICGTDGCPVFFFDPTQTAAAQLADPHTIDVPAEGAVGGIEVTPLPQAPPKDSLADLAAESQVRAALHRYGYRCADGGCAQCTAVSADGVNERE